MNRLKKLSKILAIILLIASFFMLMMLIAGSHGHIDLMNAEIILFLIAIGIYIITGVFLINFIIIKNRFINMMVNLFLTLTVLQSLITLFLLITFDFEETSSAPYIMILLLLAIAIIGVLILKIKNTKTVNLNN